MPKNNEIMLQIMPQIMPKKNPARLCCVVARHPYVFTHIIRERNGNNKCYNKQAKEHRFKS